jgi:hypothetical protein
MNIGVVIGIAPIIMGLMVVLKFGVTIYSPVIGDFKSPSFAMLALIFCLTWG